MKISPQPHSVNTSPGIFPIYVPTAPPAATAPLDLAARRLARRWGIPVRRAKLVAELAGLGGRQ